MILRILCLFLLLPRRSVRLPVYLLLLSHSSLIRASPPFHIRELYLPFSAFFLNGFLIFADIIFKKKLAPTYAGAVSIIHLIISVVRKVQSVEDIEHQSHQHADHARQHHSGKLDTSELYRNAGQADNEDNRSHSHIP